MQKVAHVRNDMIKREFFSRGRKNSRPSCDLGATGALWRAKDTTGRAKVRPVAAHIATGRDMVATLGAPLGTLRGPKPVPWEFQQKIFGKS